MATTMNKQNNTTMSSATRTFVGISMMALAMVSFTACGKKSDPNPTDTTTTGGATGDMNNTPTTTGGTTMGGTTGEPNATTTAGGNTTMAGGGITGNQNGVAVSLPYAVVAVNANATTPSKKYAINFLSYNPFCFYTANPDPTYSSYPNSFDAMSVYLTDGTTAPTAGSYSVGGTMAIDPNSGFEAVTNCVAPSAAIGTGSTLTLTAFDATAKTASGTVTVTLSDGTALSGSFTTTAACDKPTDPATAAAPVCTDATITYK